jgi:hypothetical protein
MTKVPLDGIRRSSLRRPLRVATIHSHRKDRRGLCHPLQTSGSRSFRRHQDLLIVSLLLVSCNFKNNLNKKIFTGNLDEFIGAHQKSRQVSCFGKCALCVLLNIVFVFTLFVALFIGHFSTDSSLSSNTVSPWLALLFCFFHFFLLEANH